MSLVPLDLCRVLTNSRADRKQDTQIARIMSQDFHPLCVGGFMLSEGGGPLSLSPLESVRSIMARTVVQSRLRVRDRNVEGRAMESREQYSG